MEVRAIGAANSSPDASAELPIHRFDDPMIAAGPPGFAIGSFDDLAPWSVAPTPHRHEFYELVCVTSGSGTHVIDFVPYDVRPVSLYFVAPGQVQFWEPRSVLDGWVVVFLEDFLAVPYRDRAAAGETLALDLLDVGHALEVAADDLEHVVGLFQSLQREYQHPAGADLSVLQAYLHILIVQLRRLHSASGGLAPSRDTMLARRYLRMVGAEIPEQHTVTAYAERIGVTPKYLADVVKRVTGKTPAQVIRAALTVEGKRLLTHTPLSVAQVSARLCFDNPSYFGRFFKRETGMPPGEYRRLSQSH